MGRDGQRVDKRHCIQRTPKQPNYPHGSSIGSYQGPIPSTEKRRCAIRQDGDPRKVGDKVDQPRRIVRRHVTKARKRPGAAQDGFVEKDNCRYTHEVRRIIRRNVFDFTTMLASASGGSEGRVFNQHTYAHSDRTGYGRGRPEGIQWLGQTGRSGPRKRKCHADDRCRAVGTIKCWALDLDGGRKAWWTALED